ncbi:hypothetical protein BSLG_002177 [Batrachochytrium salamandrivorans]|nr:hypothetical protein BSLG_009716 [Batrachochytrium salamandrivorans]KAJ1343151.1 hypothetical protein BSLG_002177 [Batrachochytrium salamandrivorans]
MDASGHILQAAIRAKRLINSALSLAAPPESSILTPAQMYPIVVIESEKRNVFIRSDGASAIGLFEARMA